MEDRLKLHTARLELLAGTAEVGHAEIEDRQLFSKLLGAQVPDTWPPPLNDIGSMTWFTNYLQKYPQAIGWAAWYFLLKEKTGKYLIAIGNGGFKGLPGKNGIVEIGYSILEKYQGKGFASEGVARLIEWAFSHQQVTKVIAQTLPHLFASIAVLKKNNFVHCGSGYEKGAILYELDRHSYFQK